ncbi:MAG: hypothetical protein J6Y19_04505 [Kiritimatiellae bacterium]|nr:hypothetical protein [Kiritimatiellia bacterium]MBQ9343674.1 hypothetical protein [Kiritimatiellia bacterium]
MALRRINIMERVQDLRKFWAQEHRAPTFEEMVKLFHYKSKNSVSQVIGKLERLGYVKRTEGRLSLLPKLLAPVRQLGSVVAGFPVEEDQLADAPAISLDEYLVPATRQDRYYMLSVRGDSMKDAGILEGDLVIVEREAQPKDHDVVVACVDGEWTLKYYVPDQAGIRLEPANPKYKFLRAKRSLIIGGIVRSVVRKY